MSKFPILVLSLVAVAGAAYLVWGGEAGQQEVPDTLSGESPTLDGNGDAKEASAKNKPAPKVVAAPAAKQRIRELAVPPKMGPGPGSLLMPDGTYLPVLNGAIGAPAVNWPEGLPYSPVIKKVIDDGGLEWYQHKDGSFTITQNEYRADLGRIEAATTLYNPKKPTSIAPEEAEKARREARKDNAPGSGDVKKK